MLSPRRLKFTVCIALVIGLTHLVIKERAEAGVEVYLTLKQALLLAFKGSQEVKIGRVSLSREQRLRIEARAGYRFRQTRSTIYRGVTGEKTDGYALVMHEKGKSEPITFMVVIDPKGKVKDVYLMVYREPRGGEVRQRRFLRQFIGKSSRDPLRITQDIVYISGATLSSRSLAVGVKKALALVEEVYLKGER
ncbi:MAG: FMN-binding protein [Thermodesulfobacteriota bacterium]